MKVSSHLKCLKVLNWKMLMMKSRTKKCKTLDHCWDVCCKGASNEAFCRALYHLEVIIYVVWRLQTNTYRTNPQYYWDELHFYFFL